MAEFSFADIDSDPDSDDERPSAFAEQLLASMRSAGHSLPGGPPDVASAEEVRQQRQRHVAVIFENYELLQRMLLRHEETIRKRWMKKTKQQKQKILLAAWGPGMPLSHRPDFAAYEQRMNTWGVRKSAARQAPSSETACMWPFINLEDLSKPKALPLFLHSRGHNPPCDFSAADLENMHMVGPTCTRLGTGIARRCTPSMLKERNLGRESARDIRSEVWRVSSGRAAKRQVHS